MATVAIIGRGEIIFVILTKLLVSLELSQYIAKVIVSNFSLLYFVSKIVGALLRPSLSQQLRNVCDVQTKKYFISVIALLIAKDLPKFFKIGKVLEILTRHLRALYIIFQLFFQMLFNIS